MKLIKTLGSRMDKTGRKQSWGIFWCDKCKREVERRLSNGYINKSCGCQQHSKEISNKIAISHIGKKQSKETIEKRVQKNNGKKRTEGFKQKISVANKGKKRTEEQNKKQSERMKGLKYTEERKQKMSESHVGKHTGDKNGMFGKKGSLSSNWNNGSSFEPYSPEFNKQKKQFILERDNYTCQTPECLNTENLHVHHIDYNKKNSLNENLTTLCNSCHSRTNGKNNRLYYIEYYQNIIINRIIECLL